MVTFHSYVSLPEGIQFHPSTRSQSSRHPILRQRRAEVAFHQLEGRSQTALMEEGFEEGQAKDAAHAFRILSCGWSRILPS